MAAIFARQENVGRLQVAMDEALRVHVGDCIKDLTEELPDQLLIFDQLSAIDDVPESHTMEKLHLYVQDLAEGRLSRRGSPEPAALAPRPSPRAREPVITRDEAQAWIPGLLGTDPSATHECTRLRFLYLDPGLVVADDVHMSESRQDGALLQNPFSTAFCPGELDAFDGVKLPVNAVPHLRHRAEASGAKESELLEVLGIATSLINISR
mmetsp:Transcript_14229/g.31153  ORF Transcript_14229/g.31153 Transcript_14229/m.31153 type:complete len:210 (+) Transcript_14229:1222-1851(+)